MRLRSDHLTRKPKPDYLDHVEPFHPLTLDGRTPRRPGRLRDALGTLYAFVLFAGAVAVIAGDWLGVHGRFAAVAVFCATALVLLNQLGSVFVRVARRLSSSSNTDKHRKDVAWVRSRAAAREAMRS